MAVHVAGIQTVMTTILSAALSKIYNNRLQSDSQNQRQFCLPLRRALCEKRNFMSPTVFRENGYRFFFFSREEDRMHVHITSGDGEAKFWLQPDIELARNYSYSRLQLKNIEKLIERHYDELFSAWQKHFPS